MEHANTMRYPFISDTNMNKTQIAQNTILRTITSCSRNTNLQLSRSEREILPIKNHLKRNASRPRQQSQHPEHTFRGLTVQTTNHRHNKKTIYDNNNNYSTNLDTNAMNTTEQSIKQNMRLIHSSLVTKYKNTITPSEVLNLHPPSISKTETTLPRNTRKLLAQLIANKRPFFHTYTNKLSPENTRHHSVPPPPLQQTTQHCTSFQLPTHSNNFQLPIHFKNKKPPH